jgi:predicted transcriptional regulator
MKGQEAFCDLLFEISHEDRLRMMEELSKEPLTATSISRRLDIPTQEASRHLARLTKIGLTGRSSEGQYTLTPYGTLSLNLLAGERFASRHREYFASHTTSKLPPAFAARLGELSEATYIDDVMITMHNVERVIREAQEYVVRIIDRYQLTTIPHIVDSLERGVEYRVLEPFDIVRPPGYKPHTGLKKAEAEGRFKDRSILDMSVCMIVSEKEVAAICFPTPDGRFDYRGFTSTDAATHKWCMELFEHYWCAGGNIRPD